LVESYRVVPSHLRILIATTSQPKDLLIFGGEGNANSQSHLGPFLSASRNDPNTKTHKTWAPSGSNNLSEPSGEERAAEFNSESVALGSIHALTNE
ncbi:hypothetical protein PROFUN_07766, partial [Planoprotostelium fungivorum]